ncbi:MAG: hypothetical protein ACFFCQ_17995 [Promethearchaeota archaeon]
MFSKRRFGCSEYRIFGSMPLADGIREFLFGRQKVLESFNQVLKTETLLMSLFDP